MSPLSDGRQETGGTWKQSLSSEGDTGPSPRTSGMAMKPPALQRQSSIVIPSMVPTQEVLQNLSRYRSDSGQGRQDCHSVEHMESDEETLILGQRVISNQENSDGSIAITYDDISLIPSPFLLSAPQTQPFYSTTPTTRAESVAATTRAESVAALRDERRITPPSRANLPAYNANVTLASAAAARKPTAKETKGKEGTKDEIDDEDSDPIMDFDDTDDDRDKGKEVEVCKEQDPDPIVSTLDPPFLPPTTGAGNLRSPSRRFVLPVGATGKSNIGPRGQHHQQQGNLKDSPNGRKLRPASMVPQPIPPPFLHVQQQPWSPRSRGNGKGAVSPTQKLVKARQGMVSNIPPGSPPSTTNGADSSAGKKTPTRSVSAIGRSLRNIIPPAPLGPQLLQIAKDEQDMEHERKRRRLEKSKAVEQEIDVAYLPQGDEMVSRGAPMSLLPASITKQILSTRPTDVFSSNSLVQTSRTSSTTAALVAIKQEPLTQIMAPQENVALDTPILTSEPLQPPAEIPLPGLVLEYASKLTPIDQIKWPPAKPGRFHIFGLIMSIGLEEQIVSKAGQGSTKRLLSVCDQSATSFKLDLWRERCRWGDLFRPGDVVLITGMSHLKSRFMARQDTIGHGAIEPMADNTKIVPNKVFSLVSGRSFQMFKRRSTDRKLQEIQAHGRGCQVSMVPL
ncbi:MAG: hypothetical protein J3Q66DRAFT_67489 [Benniella sp.]|nr:MAG: hypothetical protein J3Q66DRAFT_67489 [Benniella sp.]